MKRKDFGNMNLQFFAEAGGDSTQTGNQTQTGDQNGNQTQTGDQNGQSNSGEGDDAGNQLSVEEQLQQMRIENAKLKKAQEDAAKDASSWKKKYNATLSDAEKLAQEKAEREAEKDAELNRLRKESAVSKFEKNFLTLGYSQELAKKAAEAQFDGDTDTLFLVQSQAQEAILKTKESEWFKKRPEVNTGVGSGGEDPFLRGFNS